MTAAACPGHSGLGMRLVVVGNLAPVHGCLLIWLGHASGHNLCVRDPVVWRLLRAQQLRSGQHVTSRCKRHCRFACIGVLGALQQSGQLAESSHCLLMA